MGWGTHVNPWLIHVNVRQKPLQYCKVISLQLIKINEKKKKNDLLTTKITKKTLTEEQLENIKHIVTFRTKIKRDSKEENIVCNGYML